MDWTKLTNDPVDEGVRGKVIAHLNSIRRPLEAGPRGSDDYLHYLRQVATGKTVLDIGVCEHTQGRADAAGWKHQALVECASEILGVDILEELVEGLSKKGYNVRCCDASSEEDLGKRFAVIHAGDVIEHVDSPVALMAFCKRHLDLEGKLIVRTPNPYNYSYIRSVFKYKTDKSNLEHVCYVTPVQMLEIARRCGMRLDSYYTVRKKGRSLLATFLKFIRWGFLPDEIYSTIFVYELSHADN